MSGKRKVLVSGAVYHNFEESPIFKGQYLGEVRNDEEKLIGFLFVNSDGEEMIVSNSFAIEKAINIDIEGTLVKDMGVTLEITFLGKTIVKKTGKPFNRFQVVMID
jgi:hypothetical protein